MLAINLPRLLLTLPLFFSVVLADCAKLSTSDITNNKWEQHPNLDSVEATDDQHFSYNHEYTFAHRARPGASYDHHSQLLFSANVLKSTAQGQKALRSIELKSTLANRSWDWKGRPFRLQFVMHTGYEIATADYWIKSQDSCTLQGEGDDGFSIIPFYAEDIKEVVLWRKL